MSQTLDMDDGAQPVRANNGKGVSANGPGSLEGGGTVDLAEALPHYFVRLTARPRAEGLQVGLGEGAMLRELSSSGPGGLPALSLGWKSTTTGSILPLLWWLLFSSRTRMTCAIRRVPW